MFGFPRQGIVEWQVYTGGPALATTSLRYQQWIKPYGCSQVFMLVAGPGGPGAGGTSAASGARSGGGGGGSGGVTKALFPACILPDVLYVRAGGIAVGGAPNTAGVQTSGNNSVVCLTPDPSFGVTALIEGWPGGAGAVAGTAGAAGGTGVGLYSQWGITQGSAGQAGAAGGSGAVGTGLVAPNTLILTGGGGGGGVSAGNGPFNGGDIGAQIPTTGAKLRPLIPGGNVTVKTGSHGFNMGIPIRELLDKSSAIVFSGGGGGYGESTGGFPGGDGAWGCGGGGGGAGSTGGAGGDGGPGFVIIGAW